MMTLGFSSILAAGALLPGTLLPEALLPEALLPAVLLPAAPAQDQGLLSVLTVFDTVPWREVGLTFAVVLGAWLIRRIGRRIINTAMDDRVLQYRWRKTLAYLTTGLAIVFVIGIWVDGLSQVGTFLGLVSAGVAIALKDLLVDIAGWLVLITKPPFEVGDRIQIGEHSGDVVDISVLHFHLVEIGNWVDSDQSTGRVIQVPNKQILTHPIANYTSEFPFLWHEVPVAVTFESDWRKAKKLFLEMVSEQTHETSERAAEFLRNRPSRMLVLVGTVTATVYTSVLDHGVCLSMRFLTDPRRRRGFDQALWEGVLDIVSREPDIDLAYPTQRFVNLEDGSDPAPGTSARARRELVERGLL